jgi:hypothetical protein
MSEGYRAFIIGPDGHVIGRIDIGCADENEARRHAKAAVDGHAVELWQLDRCIVRFEPDGLQTSTPVITEPDKGPSSKHQ